MSDVCDQYITRTKHTVETQYESILSDISTVIQLQGWKVEEISFITGARSVLARPQTEPEVFQCVRRQHTIHMFETSNESIRCLHEHSQMHVYH